MATRRKLKTSGQSSKSPEITTQISPVAQILQAFATGGPSVTKGLTPVGDSQSIGANNANLNAALNSTVQNRFNYVNQVGQEALRRTESAMAEERAKQETARQNALQQKLIKQQQDHAAKMQRELLAAQTKAQQTALKATTGGGPGNGGGNSGPISLPTAPPTVAKPKGKTTSKDSVKAPVFPPAAPPNTVKQSGSVGGTKGKSGLPKCEPGFVGVVKRGLGLCQ